MGANMIINHEKGTDVWGFFVCRNPGPCVGLVTTDNVTSTHNVTPTHNVAECDIMR